MFDKFKTYIYILIFVVPCLVCFSIFSNNGYCSSVALSGQASSSLGNSLGSVFDLSGISASPDPVGLSIGLSQIYDRLDMYLYQNYNYDLSGTVNDTLESGMPYINQDAVLQDSFVSTVTNGIYNTMQELTGYGYALYKAATIGLQNAKDTFFVGKAQDGVITEVLDNAVVYVDDDVLSAYSSALSNAIEDDYLYNLSLSNNFLYGKNFHFVTQYINWTVSLPQDVAISTRTSDDKVWIVSTLETGKNNRFSASGVMVLNGTPYNIDYAYISSQNQPSFTVNGVTYYVGILAVHSSYGETFVSSAAKYGDVSSLRSLIENTSSISATYSLSPDIEATIQELLAELKGHYVSTSDLDLIIDSLIDNGVISNENVVSEGVSEYVPVIDYDSSYIDTLEGIIEGILERSAVYDDVISDSNATVPDNDDYIDQGISIPANLDNSLFNSVWDVLRTPFQTMSVFSPIFAIFGSGAAIFSLWLFLPSFIIILLVIWALK